MIALTAQGAAGEPALAGPRRKLAIACLLAALALVVQSAAIISIALPELARSLQVTPAAAVRVITAYQLALVIALLPCAALGESLGHRRVFTGGVALFAGGSLLCALAPSLHWLLVARFLQGLGGAAVMALEVALLRFVVPSHQLGAAVAWNALTVALSSAAGPTLGALLMSVASLPWLFAINVPLGALVLLATRALPQVEGTQRALDTKSIGLTAAVFASLVLGAELMPWSAGLALALLGASVALVSILVRRELPKLAPLLPLDLLRARSFRISVVASITCFAGQAAALVALPFHLQHGFAQDAVSAGLMIMPWPLGAAITAPLAGRLAERVPATRLCAAGGACLALGLTAIALWPPPRQPLALVPFIVLCGAGFALFQVPNNRNLLLAAPRARSGAAGGMQGTARLLGQTIGAVMMSLLLAQAPMSIAPRVALGIAALLTLSAGLVSTRRTDRALVA